MVPQMDVFAVKESWPMYLRRATVPLGNGDAQLLRKKLKQAATTPSDWIEAYVRLASARSVPVNRGVRI